MKIALVHDYIKEFGGAERVLKVLSEIYPDAPIYTAFCVKGSTAEREFAERKIIESSFAPILKIWKLYSPLRFLIPVIWRSFDLSKYDLVITSSSWYVTRGFKVGKNTKVIDYCHTPPRWLYGYETSVGFTRFWPVKIYAAIVGHFIRIFDFKTAQGVDYFIANSKNVQERIKKFYRRDSTVIYPPCDVEKIINLTKDVKKENFFLIASRLTGAKGIEEAIRLSKKIGFKLKIVGEGAGYSDIERNNKRSLQDKMSCKSEVEFLGRLNDEEHYKTYAKAKGFIALAKDEDFGMTLVEAQAAGTPVIAFNGGGFKESVINNETGVLIDEISEKSLKEAINKVNNVNWNKEKLISSARKFSKEKFVREIKLFVKNHA
ncbi:MAG: glycosyltransferase [Candidatus Woesebacteria bacterium]|nr:glycosyltransferase [Candidatus Woesebacteria bacterium]